jgi:hypothetical protein
MKKNFGSLTLPSHLASTSESSVYAFSIGAAAWLAGLAIHSAFILHPNILVDARIGVDPSAQS